MHSGGLLSTGMEKASVPKNGALISRRRDVRYAGENGWKKET